MMGRPLLVWLSAEKTACRADVIGLFVLGYAAGRERFDLVMAIAGALLALRWLWGWAGLNQWPSPYGRYYRTWLRLPSKEGGDYYPWLANQMGGKEPWATWVKNDQSIRF